MGTIQAIHSVRKALMLGAALLAALAATGCATAPEATPPIEVPR